MTIYLLICFRFFLCGRLVSFFLAGEGSCSLSWLSWVKRQFYWLSWAFSISPQRLFRNASILLSYAFWYSKMSFRCYASRDTFRITLKNFRPRRNSRKSSARRSFWAISSRKAIYFCLKISSLDFFASFKLWNVIVFRQKFLSPAIFSAGDWIFASFWHKALNMRKSYRNCRFSTWSSAF